MRRIAAVFIVLLLAAYPASMARGGGEIPGGPTDSSGLLRVPWKVAEHRLANGMRALMLQDRRAPSIVFQVWYGVGSRDEPKGKTGVAHMLEHTPALNTIELQIESTHLSALEKQVYRDLEKAGDLDYDSMEALVREVVDRKE